MRRLVLTMVILAPLPAAGFAQAPEDSWGNLKQLRVGNKVEVVDLAAKKVKGRFLEFSENAILLRVKKQEVSIPRLEVVLVSRPASKAKTILLGILAGALIGAQAWIKADRHARGYWYDDEYRYSCENRKGLSGRSAVIFSGAGAGAAGLASAFTKGAGKVIYAHDPNKAYDPATSVSGPQPAGSQLPLAEFDLRPTRAGYPEGGNVFAPVIVTETTGPAESNALEGPH